MTTQDKIALAVFAFALAFGSFYMAQATDQQVADRPAYDCRNYNNCQFYGLNN